MPPAFQNHRIHPHKWRVFFFYAGVDDDLARVVTEPAIHYLPNLNIPIENRRFGLQGTPSFGASNKISSAWIGSIGSFSAPVKMLVCAPSPGWTVI